MTGACDPMVSKKPTAAKVGCWRRGERRACTTLNPSMFLKKIHNIKEKEIVLEKRIDRLTILQNIAATPTRPTLLSCCYLFTVNDSTVLATTIVYSMEKTTVKRKTLQSEELGK